MTCLVSEEDFGTFEVWHMCDDLDASYNSYEYTEETRECVISQENAILAKGQRLNNKELCSLEVTFTTGSDSDCMKFYAYSTVGDSGHISKLNVILTIVILAIFSF